MFNTNEHILHLYECIDEMRDDIHDLRMRQSIADIYTPDYLSTASPRRRTNNITGSGLNWSVELENERSAIDDLYLGLPPIRNLTRSNASNNLRPRVGRRSTSAVTNSARNSTRSPAAPAAPAAPNTSNTNRRTTIDTRPSRVTRTTSGTTTTRGTPNSVEFTIFEPRISSVRDRLDNLLTSLQADIATPITPVATPAVPAATPGEAANNFFGLGLGIGASDNSETRRLTLAEINTGCETKIYSGPEDTCSICREPINGTSIIREIKNCRHQFHQLCLDTWLENRRTCPICRGNIVLNPETAANRVELQALERANSVVDELD
jgi:hypothetical protein